AKAGRAINQRPRTLRCVGTLDPGFCSVEEMSRDDMIAEINASKPDFLAVSLGAQKGQAWLQRNHDRLTIPVRAHLGAALSFQAGTIKRAPLAVRGWGLEWLWRIKEEPYLWRRYGNDALVLLRLLSTRVLPLAALSWYHQLGFRRPQEFQVERMHGQDPRAVIIRLNGVATARDTEKAAACFRDVIEAGCDVVTIDLAGIRLIDARFLGLLLMLRKHLRRQGARLSFVGLSRATKRIFRLNELQFLLD